MQLHFYCHILCQSVYYLNLKLQHVFYLLFVNCGLDLTFQMFVSFDIDTDLLIC